ncbi:permease [Vibrio viridaestus]|uniref:Permease n=1 Tax=Vibrio viridaestus TaxID=2487322 RepID=A0A3N9TKV1_9VIBR|nr:permease [Vibrio viridaestus]RQW64493.1 permease [Vibrio viridaestus]
MLAVFTYLADWITYQIIGLNEHDRVAQALHFFIEDTTKILVLLIVMIYLIALIRAGLDVERVRNYLAGRRRAFGYFSASFFGAITPFCSCSSIPVFLGFTTAGIPLGITMAFLITSPLINEVAVLLLFSLLGWKLTMLYIVLGMSIGVLSGWLLDHFRAERWLKPFITQARNKRKQTIVSTKPINLTLKERHQFAKDEVRTLFLRVWLWVFIGVGIGAGLHGFVPDGWINQNLGDGQWWTVPLSVLIGIPLYSNATGVIPVMESLIKNGLPVGTTLAFCMSTVAASIPEFVMLKQVMEWRLLVIVFCLLLTAFNIIGWMINFLQIVI